MYHNRSKGFTLIELLVVIAIIGILSSVVLASLNTARTKGQDAAIQSNLAAVQTQAELEYSNLSNSYNTTGSAITSAACSGVTTVGTFLANGTINNALKGAKSNAPASADSDCGITASAYSVAAPLSNSKAWCIDSTGVARGKTAAGVDYTGVTGATGAHTLSGAIVCN